jgi:glucose/arabinose dehydrogenase
MVQVGVRQGACIAGILVVLGVVATPASAAVQLVPFGSFSAPIYVTAPTGDNTRVFVVERAGKIQVVSNGVRKQFLDITSVVLTGGERGLLSMAFAPDYATSGTFYVFYTTKPSGNVRIEQYHRSAADPDLASPLPDATILDEPHGASNHNGGQLQVGPDGFLYATIGDNANGSNSQSTANVYGKLLRINPATGLAPPDNPFVGIGGADARVFALGLRNTWRFSFDRANGQLVMGDVGGGQFEEVDIGAKGANYGWPTCEGTCANPSFVNPVLQYPHTASPCGGAITGGYVVHADDLPSLAGRYIYGDYCSGAIRSAALATPVTDDRSEGLNITGLVSFGEDAAGHIYAVSQDGTVSRLSEPGQPTPTPTPAPTPQPEPQPSPPAGPLADLIAPTLLTRFRARQHLSRTRTLTLGAGCKEVCSLRLSAKVSGTGAKRAPRAALVASAAQRAGVVKHRLRFSRRSAARIRAALRRHRRVVAVVRITAKDAAGNAAAPKTVRIRITG